MPSFKQILTYVTPLALLFSQVSSTSAGCSSMSNIKMTNYGWDDNSPPSAQIAYSCPRGAVAGTPAGSGTATGTATAATSTATGKKHHSKKTKSKRFRWAKRASSDPKAGGVGTYADPLTMATSASLFTPCSIFYVPRLQKYVIFEDDCVQCDSDAKKGITHIDIWTGSNTGAGGSGLLACEDTMTPSGGEGLMANPPNNLPVNSTPLYSNGVCAVGSVLTAVSALVC